MDNVEVLQIAMKRKLSLFLGLMLIAKELQKLCVWNFGMKIGYNMPKILCEILWVSSYKDGVVDNKILFDQFNTVRICTKWQRLIKINCNIASNSSR